MTSLVKQSEINYHRPLLLLLKQEGELTTPIDKLYTVFNLD